MKTKTLRSHISKSGKSQSQWAQLLGVPAGSFRAWVSQNRVPADKLEILAKELGTTATELQQSGITISHPRNNSGDNFGEVFPLLKAVVDSGTTSVSFDQLKMLLEFRHKTQKDLTPEFIREFMKHIS